MNLSLRKFRRIQILVLLLAAAWIAGTTYYTRPAELGKSPSPREGFPAPAFTLNTLEGNKVNLEDFRGKVVLLNFWASWCPPCKAEMPAFEALHQAYLGQDFVILAVNTTFQDDLAAAQQFVDDNHLTFPILLDQDGKTSNSYQVLAMPSSYFIDREGFIRKVIIGGPMSEALIQTQVRQLLGEVR